MRYRTSPIENTRAANLNACMCACSLVEPVVVASARLKRRIACEYSTLLEMLGGHATRERSVRVHVKSYRGTATMENDEGLRLEVMCNLVATLELLSLLLIRSASIPAGARPHHIIMAISALDTHDLL